ncbi:MAG: MMPL family transporter [Chitinophagales bacterium]|nr:MMPL family transporter [Chitinophagales bacterium]
MIYRFRNYILLFFILLSIGCIFASTQVYFKYDFEQFFPKGDKSLDEYYLFMEKFEGDDDFLLVGLKREKGIFDSLFLNRVDILTDQCAQLPYIKRSYSITKHKNIIKTPFAFLPLDAVHLDDPSRLKRDSVKIVNDPRLAGNIVSKDAKTLVIALKTLDSLKQFEVQILMDSANSLLAKSPFDEYHFLGKPNFQTELVRLQIKEFIISTAIAAILVTIVFSLIFRRFIGVIIALVSVLLCMIVFMGFIGGFRIPLDIMSALYPILMIIVGVSDVVHFSTKYVEELAKGKSRKDSIKITIREIGIATFLTSFTTAIGFATLLTSMITPIKRFGIVAAIGVILAYLVVMVFTTSILCRFKLEQINAPVQRKDIWKAILEWFYRLGIDYRNRCIAGVLLVIIICAWGISKITTDVHIYDSLPRNEKLTTDFAFFEKELAGFRPFEIAAKAQGDYSITDYEVIREIDKVESYLNKFEDKINGIQSVTTVYKSLNRAYNGDQREYYVLPEKRSQFDRFQRQIDKLKIEEFDVLVSKDKKYGRLSASILDIGSDTIKVLMNKIDKYIAENTDTSIVQFFQTGTGVIVDKNQEYVRNSLISGMSIAFLAVSFIMALLFRNLKMVVISLIPNLIPLFICGAILGFSGIELNAPTSIIFAISFGIAVDDTIHFLSKFKLERDKGIAIEDALYLTFMETGKAIMITTVILFFGFLVLLFSKNPATFNVGLLISLTLFSALIADLIVIPIMIRLWIKEK